MSVSRYAPGSNFQSCPAATGECDPTVKCGTYPDGAHRCRQERQPVHPRHACLCGYQWISLTADALSDPEVTAILHPARHAR